MKGLKIFGIIILVLTILAGIIVGGTLGGWFKTWFKNKVEWVDQKIEDRTSYDTMKKVEDTCRSMIASYNSDKLKYEQYKESEDKQERSWGEQAKMRANTTASTYNNYIIKNSYVWKNNVPSDIYMTLEYLE